MDVHLGRLTCIFLFLFFGFASITAASVPEHNLLDVCNKTITMPEGRSVVVRWDPEYNCTTCPVTVQPITDRGYIAMTMHPPTFHHSNMEVEPVDYSSSTSFDGLYYHVFIKRIATFIASCTKDPWGSSAPRGFTLTLTEIHRNGRWVKDCQGTSELNYFCGSSFEYGYCIPWVTRCNGVRDCSEMFRTNDETSCDETPPNPSNNQPPNYNINDDVSNIVPYLIPIVLVGALVLAACGFCKYWKVHKARGNSRHISYQPRRPQPQPTIGSNRFPTSAPVFATNSSRIPPATSTAPPQPATTPSEYTIADQLPSYSDLFGKNPPGFPGPPTTNKTVDKSII